MTDEAGIPVSGARIKALPRGGNPECPECYDASRRAVRTDGDGRFSVEGLPDGRTLLIAESSGHVPASRRVNAPAEDFEIRLPSQGLSFSGRVRVHGTGEPVEGATVVLEPSDSSAGRSSAFSPLTTVSDGEGRFRFERLREDFHTLRASRGDLRLVPQISGNRVLVEEGFEEQDRDYYLYGGHTVSGMVRDAATSALLAGVRVEPTEYSGPGVPAVTDEGGQYSLKIWGNGYQDAGLEAAKEGYATLGKSGKPGMLPSLKLNPDRLELRQDIAMIPVTGGGELTVTGTVRTRDGRSVAGAKISGLSGRLRSPLPSAPTDNAGRYTVDVKPHSSPVVIRADLDGYAPVWSRPVSTPDGSVGGVDLTLDEGRTLTGTVVTTDGSPVAGARVQATFSAGNQTNEAATALTDDHGHFTLESLPAAKVEVSGSAPGYGGSNKQEILPGNPGEPGSPIPVLVLQPECFLAGRVTDEKGRPVPDTTVNVFVRGPDQESVGYAVVNTDDDGRYRADGLTSGSASAYVAQYGYLRIGAPVVLDRTDADFVLLRERDDLRLVGHVVDALTSRPVETFSVEASGGEVKVFPGRFVITGLNEQGNVDVTIRAAGYAALAAETISTQGKDIETTFPLFRGGAMTGLVVVEESGLPAAGVPVTLSPPVRVHRRTAPAGVNQTAVTDEAGRFRFDDIYPAPFAYTVSVDPEQTRYGTLSKDARVRASGTTDLGTLKLSAAQKLAGQVIREPGGAPVAGVAVVVSQGQFPVPVSISTADDGRFEIPARPGSGFYRIEVPEYSYQGRIRLDRGSTERFVIRVGGGSLGGSVTLNGAPAAARLELRRHDNSGVVRTAETTPDGRFMIRNLETGKWRMTARDRGSRYAGEEVEVGDAEPAPVELRLANVRLRARVLDPQGNPVSAQVVYVRWLSAPPKSTKAWALQTNEGGILDFSTDPGEYGLATYRKEVGSAGLVKVQVPKEGESEEITLRLDGSGGFALLVLDSITGKTVPGANCRLESTDGAQIGLYEQCDGEGTLLVPAIAPGRYRLVIVGQGYRPAQPTVDIAAGELTRVEVLLEPEK